jgi:hypothetical protein
VTAETGKLLDKAGHAVHAADTLFQAADVEFGAGRAYYAEFYTAEALRTRMRVLDLCRLRSASLKGVTSPDLLGSRSQRGRRVSRALISAMIVERATSSGPSGSIPNAAPMRSNKIGPARYRRPRRCPSARSSRDATAAVRSFVAVAGLTSASDL